MSVTLNTFLKAHKLGLCYTILFGVVARQLTYREGLESWTQNPDGMGDNGAATTATPRPITSAEEDALLKQFFAEVSEVERDNEVNRFLSSFHVHIILISCSRLCKLLLLSLFGYVFKCVTIVCLWNELINIKYTYLKPETDFF